MSKKILGFTGLIAALMLVMVALIGCGGSKESPEEFFKGKNVKVIIPFKVGGGYDFYARLVGKYMEKYMPGTTFVPVNVEGAGGLSGTNQLYASSPDGLTIGMIQMGGLSFNQIVGGEGVKYDLKKFSYLGRVATEAHVMVISTKLPYKSLADVKNSGKKLKLGFYGIGSDDFNAAMIILEAAGVPYELVTEYGSTPDVIMGILRGEIDGTANGVVNVTTQMKSGDFRALVQFGGDDPTIPADVPKAVDVVPADKKKGVQAIDNLFLLDRTIAGPPGIDKDKLEYLRAAFEKAMGDADMMAEAAKAKRPISPLIKGKDMVPKVDEILSGGETIKPVLAEAVEKYKKK